MNPEYHRTVFQAFPEDLTRPFAIVTAWNPDGEQTLPNINKKRDAEFEERLSSAAIRHSRIIGLSPDEKHAEPGWAIGCSVEEGTGFGRELDQEGIYWVSNDGDLILVDCSDGTQTGIGLFAPRLRDARKRRVFDIHISSYPRRARFLHSEEFELRVRVANRFPSFSVSPTEYNSGSQNAEGFIVSVTAYDPGDAIALADDLREHFGLGEVGISHKGIHHRVTPWSDTKFIQRAWNTEL